MGQLPLYYSHKPSARRGYLFDDVTPLFPFGFGLSYSSFALDPPELSQAVIAQDGTLVVTARVRNTGARRADQVLQLYLRDRAASVTRPQRELRRFARVTLAPGEVQTVRFELGPDDFALWDLQMQRRVEPGMFDVMLGFDSADTVSAAVEVR